MALSIKGTPQKVKMVGSLSDVSKGAIASGAVKATLEHEEKVKQKRGGANGSKAR